MSLTRSPRILIEFRFEIWKIQAKNQSLVKRKEKGISRYVCSRIGEFIGHARSLVFSLLSLISALSYYTFNFFTYHTATFIDIMFLVVVLLEKSVFRTFSDFL